MALKYELISISRGLIVEHEKPLLVPYKDIEIPGQRVDLLVGGRIIIELKAVDAISPVHQAKRLSYLKATSLRLGLIINIFGVLCSNFKVLVLKDGIERMVR